MRKMLTTLGATALFLASLATSPAQATAVEPTATGWDRCPSGYFCIFDGYNGTGAMAWFKYGSPDLRGQSMDNRASSYWNRSSNRAWSLHDNYNYFGQCFNVSGNLRGNFDGIHAYWNNRTSSIRTALCG